MDDREREVLERMAAAQELMGESLRVVSGAMVKPENKFLQILQYGSGIASILGVIAIVEIIIRMLGG